MEFMKPHMLPPRYRAGFVVLLLAVVTVWIAAWYRTTQVEIWDTHGQTGLVWSLNSDPSVSPGLAAPQWQFLIRTDVPSLYYKSGTSNTAWTKIGTSSSGGGGTVTSVACGANLSCSPSPITTTGTVSTVAAPTFSGTVTGGAFTSASGDLTLGAGSASVGGGVFTPTLQATGGIVSSDTGIVLSGTHLTQHLDITGTPIYTSTADPNGTTPVSTGAVDFDSGNDKVWFNTTGSTWVAVGGGTAPPFYDVVLTPAALTGNTNDWNPGTLGQNTLIRCSGGAFNLTGLVGGSDGKIVTLQAKIGESQFSIQNDDTNSAAANRFITSSGSPTSINVNGAHSFVYVGAESRWHILNTGVN